MRREPDFGVCARWLAIAFALVLPGHAGAANWPPVDPVELAMTSEAKAPGAPAIILFRQVDRDDTSPEETVYERIKVLADEGRKYGDVEIPYLREVESVRDIEGRTVQPDGTVVEFKGEAYDKTIARARDANLLAKAFAMPAVKAGSIIEYRYRHVMIAGWVFDSRWTLSRELFTRLGRFSLVPSHYLALTYGWPMGLPPGSSVPESHGNRIELEVHDLPAFIREDEMPPEDELKYRVEFDYRADPVVPKDPDAYWRIYAHGRWRTIEEFTDQHRAMQKAVAEVLRPGDSDEQKLRRLYARAQQVRNLSFGRRLSEQEQKREKIKDAEDVEDVWKRGYGDRQDINWLFLAMARAAGFQALPVLASTRDRYIFNPRMLAPWKLNASMVEVRLGGRLLYLDPGTPYAPFGLLPWAATGVAGLRIDKDGPAWIDTPEPAYGQSRVDREAVLALSGDGLSGRLVLSCTGLEAMVRRAAMRDQDAAARQRYLEDDVKSAAPVGAEVTLRKGPEWDDPEARFEAQFDIVLPGYAESAGRRLLLPVGIFSAAEKGSFRPATRVHPVAFHFHSLHTDDVAITLPEGWRIESLPPARSEEIPTMAYSMVAEGNGRTLQLTRTVASNLGLAMPQSYGQLRDYYQKMRANDEQQIVVAPVVAAKP